MEYTDNKSFSDSFLKASDSSIIFNLSKYIYFDTKDPELKGNLSAFIVCTLLFLILIKTALPKKKPKLGYISYTDTLPHHQWIPFFKLPLLDGLILYYKLRKDGVKIVEEVIKKSGLDVKFNIGFRMMIAVSKPHTIQKILESPTLAHASKPRFFYATLFTRLMKDGLVAAKVDTWSHHRKVVTPAFKYKSLISYCKFINNEAKAFAQSACSAAENVDSNVINNETMSELIDHHAVKIVTHIIMGSENFDFCDETRISFHNCFKRFRTLTVERFQRPELMIPPIWWLHPNRKHMEHAIDNLVKISHQITDSYRMKNSRKESEQARKTNNTNQNYSLTSNERDEELGIKPFQCLVELMINGGLSNKEISDEVATFMAAGHETVKVALDLLVFHLAGNREHQKICQTEVDKLFDSKTDVDFDLEDFSKLKYLEMCIHESMRLTPTIPFFVRELHEPLQIDKRCVIPARESVLVSVWSLHRNPEIYPDPEKYDPNRFSPENVKQRHPYSFIPFSLGIRNCIGWKIALMEMKGIMVWILRHFEMHTTDEMNDVKFLFDVTLKPERPFNVTFKKRLA